MSRRAHPYNQSRQADCNHPLHGSAPGTIFLLWGQRHYAVPIDKERETGSGKIGRLTRSLQTGEKIVVSDLSGKKIGPGKMGICAFFENRQKN
jgi:hypothetical protein